MSEQHSETLSVGRYLAARLNQLGCRHLFGIPGDFNLNLLDEMLHPDTRDIGELTWVGSANELNAAYTADGYARVGRTVGALVTTYGVGELSAINGIAGSYAENVPVVHIAGLPSRGSIRDGVRLHHTLLDGDFHHFLRMFEEVTVAQAILDHDPAAGIDRVLETMIATSKPVYLGIPLDVARVQVPRARLEQPLSRPVTNPHATESFATALRGRLAQMDHLTILAGPGVHRRALEHEVVRLADNPGVRIASQVGSKALLDETHPASLGTYLGQNTLDPNSRALVDDAAVLVMIGTVFSDFTTGFFSHQYEPSHAIELGLDQARIGAAVYPGVGLADSLAIFREIVAGLTLSPVAPPPANAPIPTRRSDEPELSHAVLWPTLNEWLPELARQQGLTLVAEAGTAFYGALDLTLPEHSDLLGQPVWSSIGYTLPATLGAALARPDRRPVLVIGDGSAQLSIQELGRLLAHPSAPIVLLLDNAGYTVERKIQSPDAVYQDIFPWEWTALPAALGAPDTEVRDIDTPEALRAALSETTHSTAAFFLRVRLDRDDAPRLLLALAAGIAAANAAQTTAG